MKTCSWNNKYMQWNWLQGPKLSLRGIEAKKKAVVIFMLCILILSLALCTLQRLYMRVQYL